MAIGVFDSGVGGLNLFSRLHRAMPHADIHYYADRDHVPYSYHTPEEILSYVCEAEAFLEEVGCTTFLLACNTATSVAAQALRSHSNLCVIGMEPAIKPAWEAVRHKKGRILLTATPVTLKLPKLQNLLHTLGAEHRVDPCPLPGLVELAEAGEFDMEVAQEYLASTLSEEMLTECDAVVLGCTHFSYFQEAFKNILPPHVMYFNGYDGTIHQVEKLHKPSPTEKGRTYFWESGRKVEDEKYRLWLDRTL